MTKKDFILIAKVIESLDMNPSEKMMVAEKFAEELAKINLRFSRLKFINACFPGPLSYLKISVDKRRE